MGNPRGEETGGGGRSHLEDSRICRAEMKGKVMGASRQRGQRIPMPRGKEAPGPGVFGAPEVILPSAVLI